MNFVGGEHNSAHSNEPCALETSVVLVENAKNPMLHCRSTDSESTYHESEVTLVVRF